MTAQHDSHKLAPLMVGDAEAAAMFRVSRPTFRKWVQRGVIPEGAKIEGVRRWSVEKLVSIARDLAG